MGSHYFINDPNLKEELKLIIENISGSDYRFYTDSGVFSKRRVDFGSKLLIETIIFEKNKQLFLDLGCGYGPIGIVIKDKYPNLDVHQTDINEKAVLLAQKNSTLNNVITNCYYSDGFKNITNKFDVISLNPPIRAGKDAVYQLYDEAYKNLNIDGSFWIVIRKNQGALSHLKYLENIFDKTKIVKKSKGYYVIRAEKVKKSWLIDRFNIKY